MTKYKSRLRPVNRVINRSWIIQRLKRPSGFINPYGNTIKFDDQDAIDRVAKVFSTDYMGAFEYEHGTLPESMSRMYEIGHTFFKKWEIPEFKCWIVCSMDVSEMTIGEMKTRIGSVTQTIWDKYEEGKHGKQVAKNDYGSFYERVNGTWYDDDLLGWYDLQNDFAWFIDNKMAQKFNMLFLDETIEELDSEF